MKQMMRVVVLLLLGAFTVQAQPRSAAVLQSSFAPVVKQVAPAVVNIFAQKLVAGQTPGPLMNEEFFDLFFGRHRGQAQQHVERSLGSGVIITPQGLMVTSYHVVAGTQEVQVVFNDHREMTATLMTADPKMDIALLQLTLKQGEEVPSLGFADSDQLDVGDLVLAIGNPFGVGQSVSMGIVSALGRSNVGEGQYFIQTDAAINPGNSGGALVNADGALVGVNSAIYSKDGGSNGIAFAIPSNAVKNLINGVLTTGRVQKTWFGATGQDVTPALVRSLGLQNAAGMMVNEVLPRSPAGHAGVQVGDIVIALDGVAIADAAAFNGRLDQTPLGQEAQLRVMRGGQPMTLPIVFTGLPPRVASDQLTLTGNHPLNGYQVENLGPRLNYEFNLPLLTEGVVVVKPATGYGMMPLQEGDRLLSINGRPIHTVQDMSLALQNPRRQGWKIVVQRGTTVLQMMVQ